MRLTTFPPNRWRKLSLMCKHGAHRSRVLTCLCVIMAGGSGTRFWPLSRRKHPKQLLTFSGQCSLLEQTVARIQPVIPLDHIYIFTSEPILKQVRQLLPRIPSDQIIGEPASRNTAPTLGVAAHEIARRDPEGLMVVLPSDQIIAKPALFGRSWVRLAEWLLRQDAPWFWG